MTNTNGFILYPQEIDFPLGCIVGKNKEGENIRVHHPSFNNEISFSKLILSDLNGSFSEESKVIINVQDTILYCTNLTNEAKTAEYTEYLTDTIQVIYCNNRTPTPLEGFSRISDGIYRLYLESDEYIGLLDNELVSEIAEKSSDILDLGYIPGALCRIVINEEVDKATVVEHVRGGENIKDWAKIIVDSLSAPSYIDYRISYIPVICLATELPNTEADICRAYITKNELNSNTLRKRVLSIFPLTEDIRSVACIDGRKVYTDQNPISYTLHTIRDIELANPTPLRPNSIHLSAPAPQIQSNTAKTGLAKYFDDLTN